MALQDHLVLAGSECFIPCGLLIAFVPFLAMRGNAVNICPDGLGNISRFRKWTSKSSWYQGGYSSPSQLLFPSKEDYLEAASFMKLLMTVTYMAYL